MSIENLQARQWYERETKKFPTRQTGVHKEWCLILLCKSRILAGTMTQFHNEESTHIIDILTKYNTHFYFHETNIESFFILILYKTKIYEQNYSYW